MSGHTLLNKLLNNALDLFQNLIGQLRLLLTELDQTSSCGVTLLVHLLQEKEVLAIKGIDHLLSVHLILGLGVYILDDLTCILVHDQLTYLRVDLGSEVLLLFWKWCEEICLLCQMSRILL